MSRHPPLSLPSPATSRTPAIDAYETFGHAASTQVLKVIIEA